MDETGTAATGTTESRKREHIDTVLGADVAAKGITTGFERYIFDHCALPELSLDDIDLSTAVFGKSLKAPFLISSMTGGAAPARDINLKLAEAAQALGIAMGLGSQRAAIERADLADTYRVRAVAPDVLLFANVGAVQLNKGYGVDELRRAVEMIEADALFLHLKEGGNGISGKVARALAEVGVAAIDIAGAGGTSWSEVEAHRQNDPILRRIAHSFAGWGIPTATALIEVRDAVPELPVFASGGIRSGIDAAKAFRLGASLCGTAAPVLGSATDTAEAVFDTMTAFVEEMRIACFCSGAIDLDALRCVGLRNARDGSLIAG